MKILFLTPPTSFSERYGALAGAGSSTPALGTLLLAAVARGHGHEVAAIDAAALEMGTDEAMERIHAFQPDAVGISMTTLGVGGAAELAERIKQDSPEAVVIIGGPHVSAVPEETMRRYPTFDVAVIGEGEDTLAELLDALEQKRPLNGVQGICFRADSGVIITPRRPFIKDMDTLPSPAWELLDGFPHNYAPAPFKVKRLPSASLVTSRGCPNQCVFCDRSVFGTSCHAHSADYVMEQMMELHNKYGIRHICFEDDTFVTFKSRLNDLCERLIGMKLDLSWSCLGRVNHVDAESLSLMQRAGCWQISYGIESGSQEILKGIRKNTTLEQIRQAIAMTRRAGILSKGFFIVGHPGETRDTLRQTEDFALELPLQDISVTMLTPFPGTEIYERAEEFGAFDRDWQRLNLLNAVFVPHGLTRTELENAQKRILRRFYLRPGIIANYCGRLSANPGTIPAVARGFVSFARSVL